MNAREILEQSWALIQQPGKWTQGVYAKNTIGKPVGIRSEDATCFCSMGALWRVSSGSEALELFEKLNAVSMRMTGTGIVKLNDAAKSVQELAPVWEEAIRSAE